MDIIKTSVKQALNPVQFCAFSISSLFSVIGTAGYVMRHAQLGH